MCGEGGPALLSCPVQGLVSLLFGRLKPAMLALVPPALHWTLPEVSPGKSSGLLFLSKPSSFHCPLPFGSWWWTRPGRCPWALRVGDRVSYLFPPPPFLLPNLALTNVGAGLTQGPVSRELPTGLAGLAGLTVRGAWGGRVAGKWGAMGRGPQFFPLPGKQTKQTSPGSLAQLPPQPPHTPMPTSS